MYNKELKNQFILIIESMTKLISILGSTGSIGKQSLEVIKEHNNLKIESLCCKGSNINLIKQQCEDFSPKYYFISDEQNLQRAKQSINTQTIFLPTKEIANTQLESSVTIAAISGFEGISPTLDIIPQTKTLAIANKEVILCSWSSLKLKADQYNCKIVPVDSEHNSIYAISKLLCKDDIQEITITASGGSFLGKDKNNISIQDALTHPNWSMGAKNTIDSSTLVNKGMEYIEACQVFNMKSENVKAIIHPQSIVHGMIKMKNGFTFMSASKPDMRVHINNAINDYEKWENNLNLCSVRDLTFQEINKSEFPGFFMAIEALREGAHSILCYTVANEINVNRFLNGEIEFLQIVENIKKTMMQMPKLPLNNEEDILNGITIVKQISNQLIKQKVI